jgi:cobaltochelatase CobT
MNHLKQVFPIYAQIISGQTGIKVEIQGDQAYYDGHNKVMRLPALPLDNPELAESAWGYQYHESFHAKHSNMELLAEIAGQPLRKKLLNIIEDIWDESHQPRVYYTAKQAIAAMNLRIMNEGGFQPNTAEDHPAAIFCTYVLLQGIAYFNDLPALQPAADETEKVLREVFPVGVVTKLNALLDTHIPAIASTEDSLALTDQILQMLEDEDRDDDDDQKPDSGPQDKQPGGNNDDGDGDNQPDDSSPSTGDQPESGDSQGQGSNPDDNQPDDGATNQQGDQSSQNNANNGNPAAGPQPEPGTSQDSNNNPVDAPSVIQQTLNAIEDDLPKDKSEYIQGVMSQAATGDYRVAKPAPLGAFKRGGVGHLAFADASAASSGARKQLQRMVQEAYRHHPKVRSYGNRLDQNRMHRAMFADPNVFIHRGHRQKKDTAFHILLDASPSMRNRIQTAVEATMALGLALEKLSGINLAITRFPVDGAHNGTMFDDDVQPLLQHGEYISNNIDRFNIGTIGGTPMSDAMWYCYHQLLVQKSPRKILFVITDGDPNCKTSVIEAYEWAQSVGIETVGLGIHCDAVKKLFQVAEQINDVSELEQALFSMARDILSFAA